MAEAGTNVPLKSEQGKEAAKTEAGGLRPWSPFADLQSEIDRMFDEFAAGWPHFPFGRMAARPRAPARAEGFAVQPAVEATENEKEYRIAAELPGMDEKDIEVTFGDGAISIRGEKKEETEETKQDYYVTERRYGSFQRRFRLPEGVDAEKIDAKLKNGVLTLVLPKTAEAKKKSRKVNIKAG